MGNETEELDVIAYSPPRKVEFLVSVGRRETGLKLGPNTMKHRLTPTLSYHSL
jgi:hypothetical protein